MIRLAACLLAAAAFVEDAAAQVEERRVAQDLKRLTIEELAELDITTFSRRVERISDTPAAVSVITDDDIRRSGATTLAEAMRLADAIDVVRIHGNAWAVSARGFTISTANKLLVMIDGRTVYSPLFSGTFWDAQDFVLADVDRIEVLRGPGGAIWGANAVNGVINVITKPAAATRGTWATLTAGEPEHFIGTVRHGGRLGAGGSYRVYGKFRDRDGQFFISGIPADDTFRSGQGGFRLESSASAVKNWFVQGDIYLGKEGLFSRDDATIAGGNVMGRWIRRFSGTSEFQAQFYYDRVYRRVPQQFREARDTVDVEAVHRLDPSGRHHFVYGGHLRLSHGRDIGTAGFRFEPEERTTGLVSGFVQDEITLRANRAFLTVGSKFEHNDFTGVEVQPTIRIRGSMGSQQTVWAAVSRAVRLPTRFDTDLRLVNPVTGAVVLRGSDTFDSESVVAFEGGYRARLHERLALDASLFRNAYDDLRSIELAPAAGQPSVLANMLNATTQGVELGATVQVVGPWRFHASYAYLHSDFTTDAGSRHVAGGVNEANDPSHLFSFRSWVTLPYGLQFDVVGRYVGQRPSPVVEDYTEIDARLGWTVRRGWDISVVGQNLLHARHSELFTGGSPRYALRRGAYLRSTWRF